MSFLEPRDVVIPNPDSMRVIPQFVDLRHPADRPGDVGILATKLDASPIYTSISATCAISGSHIRTLDVIRYSGEVTTAVMTRISLRDLALMSSEPGYRPINPGIAEGEGSFDRLFSVLDLLFNPFSSLSDRFVAVCGLTVSSTLPAPPLAGNYRNRAPYDPPVFIGDIRGFNNRVGTQGGFSSLSFRRPVSADLHTWVSRVSGSVSEGNTVLEIGIRVVTSSNIEPSLSDEVFTVQLDTSEWGSAEWRDIRGTYGATNVDSRGIQYVWSVTIG